MRVGAPALSAALLRGHDLAGFVIGLDDAAAEPEVSARMSLGSSDQARAHLNPEAGSLGPALDKPWSSSPRPWLAFARCSRSEDRDYRCG